MKPALRQLYMSAALIICFSTISSAFAGKWENWRGPYGNGASDEKKLPSKWSKNRNVVWKTAMPGAGYATPIISGDHIFITAQTPKPARKIYAMAIDRKSGNVLWKKEMGKGRHIPRNNMASPSPVTDGKTVYFTFGTGLIVAMDFDGNEKWRKEVQKEYGKFALQFGFSSSPVLYKDKLILTVLCRDRSLEDPQGGKTAKGNYILGLDAATGKEAYRYIRPNTAPYESQEAYTTPVIYEGEKRAELIVMGGDCVTAHDPATGKELWRWEGYNEKRSHVHRVITSPVLAGDKVIVCGPRHTMIYALKTGKNGKVAYDDIHWKMKGGADVVVPLYYDGLLYMIDGDRRFAGAIDPDSGEPVWMEKIDRTTVYRASPTGGDGKVYCINEAGVVTVLQAGRKGGRKLAEIKMGDPLCRSSIAIADGCIFIRTAGCLYCIGQ